MKALILFAALTISSLAQASYYATHCSSADGSLRWETGHNSNTIRFESSENVEIYPFEVVNMKEKQTVLISDVNDSTCEMYSVTKKYIQEVLISAEDQSEDVAKFLNDNFGGTLKTEVFCVRHMNSRGGNCDTND